MVEGLIGKKIGMTQIFSEDGKVTPVTLIEAGPCVVVQRRTVEKDGYESAQIALWEFKTGSGGTAFDTSGVEPAIDLQFSGDVQWFGGWGVTIRPISCVAVLACVLR